MKTPVVKLNKSKHYTYLCIYFKQRKNRILVNTGFKYNPEYMTKDLQFKDSVMNGLLMGWRDAVSRYVTHCYVYRKEINQNDCLQYLQQHFDERIKVKEGTSPEKKVLDYFNDFVALKALELNHYNSQRVYNNLLKNLKEFDKNKYKLTFESINDIKFFYEFRDYSYKTLNHIDNTISKNVSILKAFMKYLQNSEIFIFKSALLDFTVEKHPTQTITLTSEEIKELYYCKKYNKFEKRLIDVFVFLCMTSMRYGDYETIQNATIENGMLTKVNNKTKTIINVPLNETALEILNRYKNSLPKFTNAYFNRQLKLILIKHNLLNTAFKKVDLQNKKDRVKEGLKRDFITVHKSRATFITLLINNNTPLTEIMPITGHKLVSTLNAYTDKRINPDATKKISI